MKKFYLLSGLALLLIQGSTPLFSDSRYQQQQDDDGNPNPIMWNGPGYYYGMWFDNEDQYDRWIANNYYYNNYYSNPDDNQDNN